MDYSVTIIICFGLITSSWTIIRIFGGSNIKRDVKDIKLMVDKMDKTLFGSNGKDGMFVEFRLMQQQITTNKNAGRAAHKRLDRKLGRDQDSIDDD